MSFITEQELTSHIRAENISAISRGDETKAPAAIDAAIQEAKSLLSKYDCDTLFSRTGDDRDPILMLYVKDIGKWHFLAVCNAGVDYEAAESRYDKAVSWLTKVQNSKAIMRDWPLYVEPGQTEPINTFLINSNPKRGNHY